MMEPEFSVTLNISDSWNTDGTESMNLINISSTFIPNTTAENRTRSNTIISVVYPVIVTEMVLSIICLVLSIIVYSLLPEFKNVHGKNLISLSGCLLTTFIFLCLDLALRLRISYAFCFGIAVIIHISFLATFFWTNVMAFDIWCNMTSMKRNFKSKTESKQYAKYSAYAWTATVLTAIPAMVLESTDLVPEQYRPQFGVKRCWLSGTTAFTYYFHIPVGIILLGNLVMFASTIRQLWLIKKVTAILQVKQQQRRLNLYLKLFFVMGITWFMEFLPWIVTKDISVRYKIYAVAGMLTALHGVLMFVIFILKRRIFRQIKKKIPGASSSQKLSTSHTTSTSGQQPTFQKYVDSEIFY